MKRIPLTRGKFALVDDADFERLNQFKWYAAKCGGRFYAARRVLRKGTDNFIYLHRFLLGAPKGMQVDHISGDSLNNRRQNLRLCTNQQNMFNSKSSQHSSRYKGVSWARALRKWDARIMHNRKSFYLGVFQSETEAAKAYNEAALKLFGEFAHLNAIESEVA